MQGAYIFCVEVSAFKEIKDVKRSWLWSPNGSIVAQEMDLQGDKYGKPKHDRYLKKETPQLPLT